MRLTMNACLLDGACDTGHHTCAIAVYPPMDSVQDFHIQSPQSLAEFPQAGGGASVDGARVGAGQLCGTGLLACRCDLPCCDPPMRLTGQEDCPTSEQDAG